MRALGRAEEAYDLLQEARRLANSMQLRYRLVPILLTLLEMEIERGDDVQIQRVRFQARGMIEYIARNTPSPWQETFLNLPEIARRWTRPPTFDASGHIAILTPAGV